MEVAVPQVSRVANDEDGKLFVLVGAGRQSAVCLRAAYELSPEEEDEANRVIPLWWPSDPARMCSSHPTWRSSSTLRSRSTYRERRASATAVVR